MKFNFGRLFREEDIAGLDIGDGRIAASRVVLAEDGSIEIRNAGATAFDLDAGEKEIAAKIRKLWRQCHIPTYSVCSCLHSKALTYKPFNHDHFSGTELDSALKLEAEQSLQLAPEDLSMDWLMHRSRNGNNGSPKGGVFVAAPQKDIDRHLRILKLAGLYPIVVDVGCTAVCNLLLALRFDEVVKTTVCVANVSENSADMAILSHGNLVFPRTIISRAVNCESSADYLIDNLVDAIRYSQFKLKQEPVEKVIVTGYIPSRESFLKRLRERTGNEVEFWNPLDESTLDVSRHGFSIHVDERTGPIMATSLGLALRRN